jgi:AcrR family transcriptional regulator
MRLPPVFRDDEPPAKRAILEAGLHLFVTRGMAATSIRDIAREAGYTNPALYKHFTSKEALAERLFIDCYLWMSDRTAAALAGVRGRDDQLEAYVETAVSLYAECPEAVLFVNDHVRELWPRVRARLEPHSLVAHARRVVSRARGEGASAVSTELATAAVIGALGQWARLLFFGGLTRPPQRWTGELVEIVRRIVA